MKRAMKSKRNWKERWFVLRATKMEWYKKERDLKPTGFVPITTHTRLNAAPEKDDVGGKAHCVGIEQTDDSALTLFIQAKGGAAEKEEWIRKLRSAVALQQSYDKEQASRARALSQSRSRVSSGFVKHASGKKAPHVPPKPGTR